MNKTTNDKRKNNRLARRNRIGNLIRGAGILFLLCSLLLFGYNRWDDFRAEKAAVMAAEQLENYRNKQLVIDNRIDPDAEMPEVIIDGVAYIGNLQIPSLGLDLPVISHWSYEDLQNAPCRYTGSAYRGDMVIAAHNYKRHFGDLHLLQKGTQIIFIDMNNNKFFYEIADSEVLQPTQVEEMTESEYDLTLFTCVYDGSARHAIRCNEIEVGDID